MTTSRRAFLGATAAAFAWSCHRSAPGSAAPSARRAAAPSASPAPANGAMLRLFANENPYGPSAAALAAARDAVADAWRYTDASEELVGAIAARHGVTGEHVVLGTGSFGILVAATVAALRAGDATVVAHPVFGAVEAHARALGPVIRVPLDRAARHDLGAMAAAITPATRLVYVCNPNNPTGTIVGAAELADFCRRHAERATVLVDEAYAEYCDDPRFGSMDALVRDGVPIAVVRTFSKLYGLAGLRVGYAIAPPAIAAAMRRARGGPDKAWIGVAGASAALASLRDAAYVAATRERVARERARFTAALERLGLAVPASHTSFVFFRHPKPDALAGALAARGIGIAAGTELGGCRITIGTPSDMDTAAAALPAALASLS